MAVTFRPVSGTRAATFAAIATWAAVALAGGVFAAQATLRMIARDRPAPGAPRLARAAVRLPPPAPLSSPGQGATGTIALPPLPPILPAASTLSRAAARPFSLGGIAAVDRGRALDCLATAVYYEAASESDDGQRAVAQVVLNRVRHPAFPATVCGVVYQGSERRVCQFSFACDGALSRAPSRSGWSRAIRNAAVVLNGDVYAPVGWATHYHTFAVTPAWNRTLVMTDAVGAHFFHRWKGFYGTPAAFTQLYGGGEPIPGPHPSIETPDAPPSPVTTAPALPVTPAPATRTPAVIAATATPDGHAAALPESTILDRWKDSGKPLR